MSAGLTVNRLRPGESLDCTRAGEWSACLWLVVTRERPSGRSRGLELVLMSGFRAPTAGRYLSETFSLATAV